jgi:hypothetical protein
LVCFSKRRVVGLELLAAGEQTVFLSPTTMCRVLCLLLVVVYVFGAAHDADVFALIRDPNKPADDDRARPRRASNAAVVNRWREEHGMVPLDQRKTPIVDADVAAHLVAQRPDPVEVYGQRASNLVASAKVRFMFCLSHNTSHSKNHFFFFQKCR